MFQIIVVKNNHPLGVLKESERSITFEYFDDIAQNDYIENLPQTTNTSSSLFPIFENLLPESEQLEYLKAKHTIKNTIGVLLYLDNIHGSFEFYTVDNFKEKSFTKEKIFIYDEVVERVLENDYTFPNILDGYTLDIAKEKLFPKEFKNNKITGLSGFQYKFGVILDKEKKTIQYIENEQCEYIMKPYNHSYSTFQPLNKDTSYIPYLLINEHLFMSLARDFGFKVPYNAIIKDGKDYHYIIKRYDRFNGLKIDHREILTLLGKHSNEKYKVSAVDAIKAVTEYLTKDELIEMFSFFVFSIIIGHGDFHAKNISLIYKTNAFNESQMQLAPYYDISTVGIYKSVGNNDIGMKILNKNNKITLEDLVWLGAKFTISKEEVKSCVSNLTKKFKDEFLDYVAKLPQNIKLLPFYKDRYKHFDTFEVVLKKYYHNRITYIDKYLLKKEKKEKKDIWI